MGKPTTKPRVNLVLEHELAGKLRRLAELQSRSMASIVVELLEAASPALTDMIRTIERLHALPSEGKAAVLKTLEQAHENLLVHAEGVDQQLDLIDDALRAAAEPEAKRA